MISDNINCLILLAICLIFAGNSMGEFQIRSRSPGSYLIHHFLFINKLIYSSKVSFKINVNEQINIYSSLE